MKTSGKNIAARVAELVTPIAEGFGYSVWDVEFVKEGARSILRITIDSESGITIDDCEKMHRAIDPVLDEADPIEEAYYLEVSSPGIERELRTDEHIRAFLGSEVEVKLYAPLDGTKTLRGTLEAFGDGKVTVKTAGKSFVLSRSAISKLQTVFDFGD